MERAKAAKEISRGVYEQQQFVCPGVRSLEQHLIL
jgi:hypothetical protein